MGLNNDQHKDGNTQASPQQPVLYRAVGWIAGTYQPSSKAYQGVLLTEDGQTIPAILLWRLRQYLKSKYPDYRTEPDFFNSPYQWTVYPLTDPLRFQLAVLRLPIHTKSGEAEKEAEADLKRPLNQFRIVGEIESFADGTVSICVRRNEPAPKGKEDNPEYQPFTLTLSGSLPTASVGEIWELEARRSGSRLVVTAGRLYQPRAEDLLWIQKHQQQSTRKKAIKSGNKAVDAADTPPATKPDTPPATKAIAPAAETLVDSKEPVASPTAATE